MKNSFLLIFVFAFLTIVNAQTKKTRIAVGTFSHETCTFCPNPTGVEEWEFYGQPISKQDKKSNSSYNIHSMDGLFYPSCNDYPHKKH